MTIKKIAAAFFFLLLVASAAKANAPCQILLNRFHRGESELVMRVNDELAGIFRYRMTEGDTANITGMFMEESHQGKKLSGLFIHAMLLRSPEIKKVEALLVLTNLSASGLVWVRRAITPEECDKAVSRTPFVKAFSKYGFKLSSCYWNESIHYLEVGMEK